VDTHGFSKEEIFEIQEAARILGFKVPENISLFRKEEIQTIKLRAKKKLWKDQRTLAKIRSEKNIDLPGDSSVERGLDSAIQNLHMEN
jgi:sRNA-binding carbon storage regulator CsrA